MGPKHGRVTASLNSSEGAVLGDSIGPGGVCGKRGLVGQGCSCLSWRHCRWCLPGGIQRRERGGHSQQELHGGHAAHLQLGQTRYNRASVASCTARSIRPVRPHCVPALGGRRRGGGHHCAIAKVVPHSLGHPYKVLLTGKTTEAAREAGSSHPRRAAGHGASCVECGRRNRLGHPFVLWQG